MKNVVLKINHILFSWYYSRCGDHFRQYTFIKSVKLLIEHWKHDFSLIENEKSHNQNLTKDNDALRSELNNLKIKMVANDKQIDFLNEKFGTNYSKRSDN